MSEPTDSPASSSFSRLPRNVWVVTVTSFLTDVSSEMVINLLPLFLANVLGVRTSAIGVIEGIAEATASVLKVFSGWFSDRLGQRKWLAVIGYGISAAAKPFLVVAASWSAVLGVRVADRIGKGVRTAPRDALLAESIQPGQRGLAFGLHRAGDTAGALFGLLIALGIVLATQAGAVALTRNTFQMVVLASIVPAFLAVIVLAFSAAEVRKAGKRATLPRLTLAAFDTRFKVFLLAVVIFTLGNSSDAFLILRAQERGLSVPGVLGMLATFNLVYALVAGPAGALSDRIGRQRLIVAGWMVYAAVYCGFALANAAWHVWGLYALYGV
ncbi:MAG: MFS transporter, partial [Anaerolineae bacterium]|nr:MFS transporter [Anaerolineae bacterium]